ncbi:MAG: transcription antitermination factor NusB [Actinomycetaceae bacterium]|nr:transcription antitermination factor NusB [Actinomycetaceae bacterium]
MTPAPNRRRGRVSPARTVAFETLVRVEDDDAYANLILPSAIWRARLDRRDAAFATELTYGTLRNQGRIDWVLGHLVNRPLHRLDTSVRVILRLTAHQLLHLRVPNHAAVAEGVELAKLYCERGAEKFVNGTARSLVEKGVEYWEQKIHAIERDAERVSVEFSHPQWIVRAFAAALSAHGRDPRELEELLAANNVNPEVSLCARPGMILPADLADDAEYFLHTTARPGDFSEWSVILSGGDPGRLNAIRDGRAAVQDEASQLVTTALANVPVDGIDRRWLDMCAGPGGKAGLLGAFAQARGAQLLANEVAPHRARLVEQTVAGLDRVSVQVGDGRELGGENHFDRILLDAPCSGLGSLRRRPESRWRHEAKDVPGLVKLQSQLLSSAWKALAPGGVLAYVTCTPHVEETLAQVQKLQGLPDLEVLPAAQLLDEVAMNPIEVEGTPVGQGNVVQMWPHLHGTDAMFLSLMRKKS